MRGTMQRRITRAQTAAGPTRGPRMLPIRNDSRRHAVRPRMKHACAFAGPAAKDMSNERFLLQDHKRNLRKEATTSSRTASPARLLTGFNKCCAPLNPRGLAPLIHGRHRRHRAAAGFHFRGSEPSVDTIRTRPLFRRRRVGRRPREGASTDDQGHCAPACGACHARAVFG